MWPISFWLIPLIYMDLLAELYILTWGPIAEFWLGNGTTFREMYRENLDTFDGMLNGQVAQW